MKHHYRFEMSRFKAIIQQIACKVQNVQYPDNVAWSDHDSWLDLFVKTLPTDY